MIDRRSTTGYCIFLVGNLVVWRSKKQEVVARSSTEVEFRALAHGLTEVMWIKGILQDLKIKMDSPTIVFCDNQSTIRVSHNPVQHDRMKHVDIDRHYIKETLEQNDIKTCYIGTSEQRADVLTKGLIKEQFMKQTNKQGLINIHSSACGGVSVNQGQSCHYAYILPLELPLYVKCINTLST